VGGRSETNPPHSSKGETGLDLTFRNKGREISKGKRAPLSEDDRSGEKTRAVSPDGLCSGAETTAAVFQGPERETMTGTRG